MTKISKMNSETILDTFNNLKNEKDSIRCNAGIALLSDFYQRNTVSQFVTSHILGYLNFSYKEKERRVN